MNEELKKIKKLYGENLAKLCRSLFPTILEQTGLLTEILNKCFDPNRLLYDDLIDKKCISAFRELIMSFLNEEETKKIITNKTPEELMDEAGYFLYKCKTEKEIQYFKKYYEQEEELCTFKGNRLKTCHVFFAVKKNIDMIKRTDFPSPLREDAYGTSVISIQFSRCKANNLSIKNRYNHTVSNSDATFGNNLENIIPGLTASFEKEYDLNIKYNEKKFYVDGYAGRNEKYYKYNFEKDGIYFCTNNTIIAHNRIKKYDPSRYLVVDNYIFDLQKKQSNHMEIIKKYKMGLQRV